MKKILLLGGSSQQIVAIETARRLGYYTVLCDFLPDNPGQYYADQFYLTSTTDKAAVLKVAQNERIDGILAYASDPAAPTAAFVAEQLRLPTNPYWAVETLCNKDKFRVFLKAYGFHAPVSLGYSTEEKVLGDLDSFQLPVIVKPVDSSGSKGATVLHSWDRILEACDFAFSFSRSHRIIVEEFIEKKHEYLIGGDIFIIDGKVILWGLMNCHRDKAVNPLVPVGKSYPLLLEDKDVDAVKNTLQRMVTELGLMFGSINVELIVDKNGQVWPIDIGPRAGGNMIPDLLGKIFKANVVEMAVLAAMGERISIETLNGNGYFATHNLHSSRNGIYKGIHFSKEIEKHIIEVYLYKKIGDQVEYFDNASKALGIVFLCFETLEELSNLLHNINSHITIELSEEE